MLFTRTRTLLLFTLLVLRGASATSLDRRGLEGGGIASSLTRRQDDSDGCPSEYASCSEMTCYPLDGSQCCADGTYCDPGFICQETVTGIGCLDTRSSTGHNGALANGPVSSVALVGLLGAAAAAVVMA